LDEIGIGGRTDTQGKPATDSAHSVSGEARPRLTEEFQRLRHEEASSPNSSPVAYFNILFNCSTAVLAASWLSGHLTGRNSTHGYAVTCETALAGGVR
jgi:hypothetical protein